MVSFDTKYLLQTNTPKKYYHVSISSKNSTKNKTHIYQIQNTTKKYLKILYISTNFNKPKGATLTKIEPKARASQNKKLLGDLETKIGWVVVAVMKRRSIWW